MSRTIRISFLLAVICLVFALPSYGGVQMTVVNGSFEDPDVPAGDPYLLEPAGTAPPGWAFVYYNQTLWGTAGVWDILNPFTEFATGVPDGSQVAFGSGSGKVVQIGQAFDANTVLGDAYVAAVYFGRSNTYQGTQGGISLSLVNNDTGVQTSPADVAKKYSFDNPPGFTMTDGYWTEVLLALEISASQYVGKDLQMNLRAENNVCFDNARLWKVVANNYTGVGTSWADAFSWEAGVPTFHDWAQVANGAGVTIDSDQFTFGIRVDGGSSLTVSNGLVKLMGYSTPAIQLGQTGNATLIINGGTLDHFYQYGGDLKAGLSDGSNVSIQMNAGQWNVRSLRLGQSGAFVNWPDVESDGVVLSTVNMIQTGGTIDGTATVGTTPVNGSVYLGDGAGSTVTYTMNGGSLDMGYIRICNRSSADYPASGTFTLNDGVVSLVQDVLIGVTQQNNQSRFYQNGGTLTVGGSLYVSAQSLYPTLFSITGGTLQVAGGIAFSSSPTVEGRGTFEVVGSSALISAGTYHQNQYSTLKAVIGATGISPIQVSGTAKFDAGAILDVSLGTGGQPGTYTLLTAAGGITDNGINNWSPTSDHVTYAIVGNSLQVTYHADSDPSRSGTEPAPVCLIALGYDLDDDCRVDLNDFAIIASNWLQCGFNVSAACPE